MRLNGSPCLELLARTLWGGEQIESKKCERVTTDGKLSMLITGWKSSEQRKKKGHESVCVSLAVCWAVSVCSGNIHLAPVHNPIEELLGLRGAVPLR